MSPATVGRLIDRQLMLNVVKEGETAHVGSAGRPSIDLTFNQNIGSVITVDLRLTRSYAAMTNLSGQILATSTHDLTPNEPETAVAQMIDQIQELQAAQPAAPPLKALVVGAPSTVVSHSGIVELAPSLGWQNLPLGHMLQEALHMPVLVENDVNLAALGEFWRGAGQNCRHSLIFVSLGTGVGAGIILNGHLYRGASNAAGEAGFFIIDVDSVRDQATGLGDLESRIGRVGLLQYAALIAQKYPRSQLANLLTQTEPVQIRQIFDLAFAGDPAALTVFNEVVDFLTVVVVNLSVVLDPEIVVLGGASNWQWEALVTAVRQRLGSNLPRPINLRPSQLDNNAVILGGAYAALYLENVLPT
ncbi:MAG: ROK family protein [Chloroflexota bacterium]